MAGRGPGESGASLLQQQVIASLLLIWRGPKKLYIWDMNMHAFFNQIQGKDAYVDI